jgi:hypothetical protein
MAKPKLALIPCTQGYFYSSVLPSDGSGDFRGGRSGKATRINSQGLIEEVDDGVSRLNYPMIDGVVSGCPHHILEPQRLQKFQYSEDFSQSYWTKGGVTVLSNQIISPKGDLTADLITVNSGSSNGGLFRFGTWNTTLQTFSIFAKVGNHNIIDIGQMSNEWVAVFDIELGIITSVNGNLTSADIINYGNGWYRCSVTHEQSSGNATLGVRVLGENNSVHLYGAMLEEGSYPTSYIPNYGTSGGVTRSAETATDSGNASTFNDSEGVLMVEISALADDSSERFLSLSNGSSTNRISMWYYSATNGLAVAIYSGNVVQFFTTTVLPKDTLYNKISVKYKQDDFALWVNGFELATDTIGITPIGLSELSFDRGDGALDFYGKTKQIQYYNSALTDSELEQLTSWTSFSDMAEGQLYTIE